MPPSFLVWIRVSNIIAFEVFKSNSDWIVGTNGIVSFNVDTKLKFGKVGWVYGMRLCGVIPYDRRENIFLGTWKHVRRLYFIKVLSDHIMLSYDYWLPFSSQRCDKSIFLHWNKDNLYNKFLLLWMMIIIKTTAYFICSPNYLWIEPLRTLSLIITMSEVILSQNKLLCFFHIDPNLPPRNKDPLFIPDTLPLLIHHHHYPSAIYPILF